MQTSLMLFFQYLPPAPHHIARRTGLFLFCPFVVVLFLTGCGQVITLSPTPMPTATPTIALTLAIDSLPPTATPAPYTPEPTQTPTLTPTPVFHTVQSGESLLSIATIYEISVAALQDANGILDPRTLQVGQQLIIPQLDEGNETIAPTATPTPIAMQLQNVFLGDTQIGNLWILGEVQNNTDTPLEQVRVAAYLIDGSGATVAQTEALIALDLVDVNERAPFALMFDAPHPQFERYQLFVSHAVPAYIGSYYRDLQVNQLESIQERFSSYTINGTILNTGPEEAVGVQVILTGYDSLNRVVAMRKIDPEHNV
ncbi:MAG: LysM peptidoglycan-binding domain-containing protein, partial [Caldilineaceae bacterium]|nr:LysM peptidoglycan-binding domain-containing protein [Caldilineaceae bacterium]